MSTTRMAIVCMCAAVLAGTPALAGIGKGNGEIGFDFGATSFDGEVSSKAGGRLVFRGGYHFSKWFELEGESSVSAHVDYRGTLNRRADIVLQTLFLNAVLSLHSKSGNVVPYLLLGMGRASLDFPRANLEDSGAAKQFGVGCRFFFGDAEQVAFRLQVGRLMEDTFEDIFNETNAHMNYVAGFTWRLGGGA
jgi:hypothetical protein